MLSVLVANLDPTELYSTVQFVYTGRSIFKTSHLVSLIHLAKFSKLVLHCLFSLAVDILFW